MVFPAVTAGYAGAFGLLLLALSLWVVMGRAKLRVSHGDGGQDVLNRRIRAQGNFTEYVPMILLLAALLEAGGTGRMAIHALLLPLFVARLAHPFGMIAPEASMQQFACRGTAMMVTWAVLAAAALMLLVRVGY